MGQDPAGGEVRNGEAGGSSTLGRSHSKTSGIRPEETEARPRSGRGCIGRALPSPWKDDLIRPHRTRVRSVCHERLPAHSGRPARRTAPPPTGHLHHFMHAAREAHVTMAEFRQDPRALARSFMQSIEKYALDGIMVDVDAATLAGALGVPVEFPADEPAVARGARLASLADVDALPPPDIPRYPVVQVWVEAVRLLCAHFGNEVFIRGNCDQCPFALAALVRGMEGGPTDIMDPELEPFAHHLLDYCTEATSQFLRLMSATGAHMLSNGDSAAGPSVVSPRIYRRFALPYEQRMAALSHSLGVPYASACLRQYQGDPRRPSHHRRRRPGTRLQDRRPPRPRPHEGLHRLYRQPRPQRR